MEPNKTNLAILRDFLLNNDVPFNMRDYRTRLPNVESTASVNKLTKDMLDAGPAQCNTAGCGIGWAPFVIPPPEGCYDNDGYVSYERYCTEVFQIRRYGDKSNYELFEFIFGSDWSFYDNSRQGVAFRINTVINNLGWFETYHSNGSSFRYFWKKFGENYLKEKTEWLAQVVHD